MILRHLVHVVSLVLLALAAALLLTSVLALLYADGDAGAFVLTAALTLLLGLVGRRFTSLERDLNVREGYAVVALTWLAIGLVGAVPYLLADVLDSPAAAFFESVSGFTTTGATVFGDIESLPHGILFWRSLTQWIGGMGIIVLGIAILPFLGVGGMQLFQAEVPGPTPERLQPRIAQTAKLLWLVYAGLTAIEAALLMIGGMGPFDAVTHSLTTMSTGGFSPRNASIAAYDSAFIQYVIIVFMYLAGINFALHYRALGRQVSAYARDPEWRLYTVVIAIATVILMAGALVTPLSIAAGTERAFRDALFQAVSLTTTTGYVTFDYELWPASAHMTVLVLFFLGGMVGSTAGGMKTMRLYILLRHGFTELRRSLHPSAVLLTRLGRVPVAEHLLLNVLAFILLYLVMFAVGALLLSMLGSDLTTSISAAASAIGNVGPGLGSVGAVDNYGWLNPASQLVLAFLMLVGRLEVFTILVLFHPDLWRHWKRAGGRRQ
ncbi:MAG TPA: TrkH family potassium uptake protein [Longimicrobiales bacterium]|nr:TrkH family potassium uptake protein [Longimicrobiales bacterium]